ncbi:hypothetical protein NBRC10512_007022 [Rhodotorula toruloides]|uniref:RHTO0S16e02388g1_1 n=2 Tax=Rhodotorula toruloides TaxID=5286 RepID=A0A061BM75_RHOTO|nr:protein of short-chain dehydrogenase/reductase SDR family [Rhodotorula toruloides NP11]EMS20947.1 protein of short-chain dehydrogenase/reductase SDR family [Rhodotorula toruloides NP11]KAJ8294949.1 putative oxidoreductase C24B10.20 [Rhodotorula toruloides]CDR48153.1 RHTO0S16e02388g1_1 [Rhodotorula toruloides]
MSSSTTTVYAISGASRGIGFAITSLLAQRDNVLIFAGARDPASSAPLKALAEKTGKVVPVKLESANEDDAAALAKLVEQQAGHVDYVIANAGIAEDFNIPVFSVPAASFTKQFTVNTLGPLVLLQHLYPLLTKSSKPRFFVVSSVAGSTTFAAGSPLIFSPYAVSKASVNHLVAHIAREGEKDNLVATLVHPGMVLSQMGIAALKGMGIPEGEEIPGIPAITPDESATALVKIFDEAKRETHNGKFLSYDGSEIPW